MLVFHYIELLLPEGKRLSKHKWKRLSERDKVDDAMDFNLSSYVHIIHVG